MQKAKLASMANQIAGFFRSYPDEEAVAGIRRHIGSFWTPAMRERLDDGNYEDGIALDPLVRRALHRGSDEASPVRNVTSPAGEAGQGASDSG